MRMVLATLVVACVWALAPAGGWAQGLPLDVKCSGENAGPSLEKACESDWSQRRAQLVELARRSNQDESAVRTPHDICNGYIVALYPNCAASILQLRDALHSQKRTSDKRASNAWLYLQAGTWLVAFLGLIVSVAAAYASDDRPIARFVNILGAASVTAVTAIMAFYDPKDFYASELKTRTAVADIESELEYALVQGGVLVGTSGSEQFEPMSLRTIRRWQVHLSEALGQDIAKYIEVRGSRADTRQP
jgi:hypothetical protein